MKRIWIGGGLALMAAVSVGWYWSGMHTVSDQLLLSSSSETQTKQTTNLMVDATVSTGQQETTASKEALQAYDEYERVFQISDAIHEFMNHRDELTETEREVRRFELQRQLNQLEATNKISSTESLALQLAFVGDDEAGKAKALALLEAYERERQARLDAYKANPDPKFQDYKTREADIVQEVMAMEFYPDGLSQQEYLAKRLAEARQQAYGP
ncbi:MAG: hypothetical protein R3309_15960 [Reinekea sp.]|nr:hypothetical protein [Reinekea sp.]